MGVPPHADWRLLMSLLVRVRAWAAYLAARHGGERVLDGAQVARDGGEEVAWLGEGVLPVGVVPPALQVTRAHEVAVGQQHRARRFVRLDPAGVPASEKWLGYVGARINRQGEHNVEWVRYRKLTYVAMISGRSRKGVILRKPIASHWVQ